MQLPASDIYQALQKYQKVIYYNFIIIINRFRYQKSF
jgi:hypothetical protein